ncbi:lysophospholipid acyltransferase family protein [Emcibacter nanhaiensis]|uniref:1-acyl-sn-glycerol-3-phosphate acyltransferase n=1 Tax=Emcibacter nanhaiensis TaxID=1505037 RepID=A0A501PNI6_9PROT|nr:lysophospholipid acyltransferase family protein [Emcibacter nanhaiensis]TPD61662.1 1-acyl-sn-glycerol-3-phosphate acyltransferase [Emcibacter nanhaiensis]
MLLPRKYLVKGQTLWSHSVVFLTRVIGGIRLEVRGRKNLPAEPSIVAMKHQSAFDTFIIHSLFKDPAIVMKAELLRIPIYGVFCRKSGMIPIDRSAGASSLRKMMKASGKALAAGRPVIIFPEGTRTLPGEHHPYQPGISGLYRHLDKPVVPVAVNSGLYWPKSGKVRPGGTIVIEFLEPIAPGMGKTEFLPLLEQQIESASQRLLPDPSGRENVT